MSDNEIKITINGRQVFCRRDETILDAAKKAGVRIPTLCHDDRLEPYGGCRLCVVKIKDIPRPLTACTTRVKNGMEVYTDTDEIKSMRRSVLSLLLSNHPNDCMRCETSGACKLQNLAYEYKADGKQ